MMEKELISNLIKEDSLDLIQNYVKVKINRKDVSNEMFNLFFSVIELGKEVKITLKNPTYKNSEYKIVDIFITLIAICNSLNINLFDALNEKECLGHK